MELLSSRYIKGSNFFLVLLVLLDHLDYPFFESLYQG